MKAHLRLDPVIHAQAARLVCVESLYHAEPLDPAPSDRQGQWLSTMPPVPGRHVHASAALFHPYVEFPQAFASTRCPATIPASPLGGTGHSVTECAPAACVLYVAGCAEHPTVTPSRMLVC